LVDRAGCPLDNAGQNPMPAPYRKERDPEPPASNDHPSPFLSAVEAELEEVPFFLRKVLPFLLGTSTPSLRDLFWAGLTTDLLHPYLKGAVFLAIDSRSTIPVSSLSAPAWAQPLYVLEIREGRRFCAPCNLENRTLVVHRCTEALTEILRFRYPGDVEILGKVTLIARRLSPREKNT